MNFLRSWRAGLRTAPTGLRIAFVPLLFLLGTTADRSPALVFEDITRPSGLYEPLAGMMGHSAAWGDLDQDGLPDLFVGGFCDRPAAEYAPAKGPVGTKLFRNLGSGKFESIKNHEAEFCGRSSGAVFADLNKDRFPELLIANHSVQPSMDASEAKQNAQTVSSKLFKNQKGKLIDLSASNEAFVKTPGVRTIAIFDFNGDGLLDVLLLQDKFRKKKQERASRLFKNTGNLKFQDVSAEAGLPDDLFGLGVAIADLNNDSRPDFFVSHSNRLFLSVPGNKYREATELRKVFQWTPLDDEDWPCGVAFGDLNRDAMLDLVITAHHDPSRNRVFLNRGLKNGTPQFEDISSAAGMVESVPTKSPHVEIQDFDNDGLMDIYISAAWKENRRIIPVIYRNQGLQKSGLPRFAASQPIKSPMIYFPSGPTADFNMDGKIDILLVNWFSGETSRLFVNRTKAGNWVQVNAPIGSKIKVISDGKIIGYQQVYIGYGFSSGQLPLSHFGVGNLKTVDLEVTLPDGAVKKKKNIAVNRRMEF